jgi:alpha-tubulin suppressor-like RCC1 family protein
MQTELSSAFDGAGQVYVFGSGTMGKFEADPASYQGTRSYQRADFDAVERLWTDRVNPKPLKKKKIHKGDVPETPSKFLGLNCQKNTAALWGKRVVQCAVGQSTIFALSDQGEVYAWGGHSNWWHEIDPTSEWQRKWRGFVTERSQLLMNTVDMKEPEEEAAIEIVDEESQREEKVHKLYKAVAQYYDVWMPPPTLETRVIFLEREILPRVHQDTLKLSCQCRARNVDKVTRMELVNILGRDILFEKEKLGDEKHEKFKEIDEKIRDLVKRKQKALAKQMVKVAALQWEPLKKLQEKIERKEFDKQYKKKCQKEAKLEENYAKWRGTMAESRDDEDVVKTSRKQKSRKIKISGATERGNGATTPRGYQAAVHISAGGNHVGLVHGTGELYMWGVGSSGQLGLDERTDDANFKGRLSCKEPALVESLKEKGKSVIQLSCGYSHSAAVVTGHKLYIWGSASNGKLGFGDLTKDVECFCSRPSSVKVLSRVRRVACGDSHTVACTLEGHLWVWGNGDGGRLGLGAGVTQTQYAPILVEQFLKEGVRIEQVACGSQHTVISSEVRPQTSAKVTTLQGGKVYIAGCSSVVGKETPKFELVSAVKDEVITQVACGHSHSALITQEGELLTWGKNINGGAAQPVSVPFVKKPTIVTCLFEKPRNLSDFRPSRQSSSYGGLKSLNAFDGNVKGDLEKYCTHTQFDDHPWIEVDLGEMCHIQVVKIWNRDDEPPDQGMARDTFTRRLFPCVAMVSQDQFSTAPGKDGFERSLSHCVARCVFKKNQRCTTWQVPENIIGRFVRLQLPRKSYLHIAQLEVFGILGSTRISGKVTQVVCGKHVTIATAKPLSDERDVETNYMRAVCADPHNSTFLRELDTYFPYFDKHGRGEKLIGEQCPICVGDLRCEMCAIVNMWVDDIVPAGPGPNGRTRRLESVADILMGVAPPPMIWKPRPLKDRSFMGKLRYMMNVILGNKTRDREFVPKEMSAEDQMWKNLSKSDLEKQTKDVDKTSKAGAEQEDHFPPKEGEETPGKEE